MTHDDDIQRTGKVPVLRHEVAGGGVPLGLEEGVLLARGEPILRALISSIGDKFDVPYDPEVAAAMVVSGVQEFLLRSSSPFPARGRAEYRQVVWLELKYVLATQGHQLPTEVQEMLVWMFFPHNSCAVRGAHAPDTHFGHIWSSLFPASNCSRALRQLPASVIEAGDDCADGLTITIRSCLANIKKTIHSRSDHLFSFLNAERGVDTAAG